MKTFKVTTTLQVESWVDAEDEAEAVALGRELLFVGVPDGQVITDEYAEEMLRSEDEDDDE